MTAPAEMPGEDDVARALAEALRQKPIPDDVWRGMVESFHHLEGKFPDYANGYSVSTDAFRLARAAQALFAPILAEKERVEKILEITRASRNRWFASVMYEKNRALAAEAALKLVAEQDVTEIALDPDGPRRICAAAIRAEGE